MKKVVLITVVLLLLPVLPALAQEDDDRRGTIQGLVYEDVNGDGLCIDTGIEGEGPIEGIPVEFVSSDEQTVVRLQSGPDGIYGLFAAGYSNWAVSVDPDSRFVPTSERTLFAPIFEDSLVQTDVNFCVQRVELATLSVNVVLPESGGENQSWLTLIALAVAGGFLLIGILLEVRRRARR